MKLIIISLALFVGHFVSSQKVQLVNNGYENILVSISDAIPYDPDLVPELKVSQLSVE